MNLDFILGWAPKSWTTSLYKYLSQNNEIFVWTKESWFLFLHHFSKKHIRNPFDPWDIDNLNKWLPINQKDNTSVKWEIHHKYNDFHLIYNKIEYIEKYSHTLPWIIKGDCSPIYLATYKYTIPNILECIDNPYDIKFIFILRNPVEACISYFKMFVGLWWEKRSFNEAIEWELAWGIPNWCPYLSTFLYFDAIKAYKDTFWNNVKIFYFEEINSKDFLDEVCNFLKIKKHSDIFPYENKGTDYTMNRKLDFLLKNKEIPEKLKIFLESKNMKKGDLQLSTETMQILNTFFKNDINKLYNLLWNKNILNWQSTKQESF